MNARGTIDVSDGRQAAAMLLADIYGGNHVGKFGARGHVKPFIHFAQRNGGREWAKSFAHFHDGIDAIAHFGVAGVGQDTAMAQGTWPELHAAAVPTDDAPVSDQPGGFRACVREAFKRMDVDAAVELFEGFFDPGV